LLYATSGGIKMGQHLNQWRIGKRIVEQFMTIISMMVIRGCMLFRIS
jgi:hypothetical protein